MKHLYIERRVLAAQPLPRAGRRRAARARDARVRRPRSKELAAVNIFAGDLLFKNFGVTRFGRVVFYDYDEIEYLVDCNFRRIPPPPPGWDDMSGDVWYGVGAHDIFPEEFATFLLTDPRTRACFLEAHADLLDAAWWQAMQTRDSHRTAGRSAVVSGSACASSRQRTERLSLCARCRRQLVCMPLA